MSEENQKDTKLPAVIVSGSGVVAGGFATSGIAMGATGAGGLTGYVLGTSAVIAELNYPMFCVGEDVIFRG